jgi:hypothetical protein
VRNRALQWLIDALAVEIGGLALVEKNVVVGVYADFS